MAEPIIPDEQADLLAAELEFGLLESSERAAALRRQMEDPAFRARVDQWRAVGSVWIETIEPQPVADEVWERIGTAIGNREAVAPRTDRSATGSGRWRLLALVTSAAAVLMAVALGAAVLHRPPPPARAPPPPPMASVQPKVERDANVAQIAGKSGAPLLSAAYYSETGTLLMKVADFGKTEKVPELWVLDKTGKPHSLGLVEDDSQVTIKLSNDLKQWLVDGATMAITLEDRDGAPHDEPTGRILGTATLSKL